MPPHDNDSSSTANSPTAAAEVFVVNVRQNIVASIHKEQLTSDFPLPSTRLEIASQLAENYQRHGCIDGVYRFESVERARVFAILCLEFVQALISKRLDQLNKLRPGEPFNPD